MLSIFDYSIKKPFVFTGIGRFYEALNEKRS
jgi:hypothetical protein